MNHEEFLAELEEAVDYRRKMAEKIKSHNLPVIIFGAGQFAAKITEELESLDIKISGYAIDEQYYVSAPKTFLGLPLYNFDEISKDSGKYVFVLGMGVSSFLSEDINSSHKLRILDFMNNKEIIKYGFFTSSMGNYYGNCCKITYDYVSQNIDEFFEVYNLMDDDLSRETMMAYLKANISNNLLYLFNFHDNREYFNDLTREFVTATHVGGGVIVDCGACQGDTLESLARFTNKSYGKVLAIEGDPKNFVKLEQFVREQEYKNVSLFNCGLWDESGTVIFDCHGNKGSHFSDVGDVHIAVLRLDDIIGDEQVSFIKMDLERAELHALKGAVATLEKQHPALGVSIYHKKDDLIAITKFIRDIYKYARFYLRKHGGLFTRNELDLYVIPD